MSHLPGTLLDIITNIPYFLVSTYKALLLQTCATASYTPAAAPKLLPLPAPPPIHTDTILHVPRAYAREGIQLEIRYVVIVMPYL